MEIVLSVAKQQKLKSPTPAKLFFWHNLFKEINGRL
jgi:hypothetical protein